jgi:hypothetical protein
MKEKGKWSKQVRKIAKYMALMEQNKFLPPKYSQCLQPLMSFLKADLVIKNLSLMHL